jgi:hypothetical protein
MKKLVLGALLGWLAVGFSPARAQYFQPLTEPYIRQPLFPYAGALSPYGAGLFGVGPYGAMPYGTSPYNVVPNGAGAYGATAPGAPITTTNVDGLNDPGVTGHPTQFFYYAGYFFNQGGGAFSTPLPNTQPILGANPTPVTPLIGTSPLRGKANTQTGK